MGIGAASPRQFAPDDPPRRGNSHGLHTNAWPRVQGDPAAADGPRYPRAAGVAARRFLGVGGGTRSDLWIRLIATALDAAIDLPEGADIAGPAGAARLAAVAAGAPLASLSEPRKVLKTVAPDAALAPLLADRKARFDALMTRI